MDHTEKVRESIEQHNKEMNEAVIVALDKKTLAIYVDKAGDRHGEDIFLNVTDSSEKKQQQFAHDRGLHYERS